jgi:multidrug efflux pump
MKDMFKDFKPSSWSIDNRTAIYIFTIIITLAGLSAYLKLPKEQFPEIKLPQIIVQTIRVLLQKTWRIWYQSK